MGSFTLAPLELLGPDELDTRPSSLLGERVGVIHMRVDGSAADPLGVDAGPREMDRQVVDLPEEPVVAHERCEQRGRGARALVSVIWVQVNGELVFVERTRDDARGPSEILIAQRQHGRALQRPVPLCLER